jgi:hypothetical protein
MIRQLLFIIFPPLKQGYCNTKSDRKKLSAQNKRRWVAHQNEATKSTIIFDIHNPAAFDDRINQICLSFRPIRTLRLLLCYMNTDK